MKVSGLLKLKIVHKNHLLDAALGIGLLLRDIQLVCFAEKGQDTIPDYVVKSCIDLHHYDSALELVGLFKKALEKATK